MVLRNMPLLSTVAVANCVASKAMETVSPGPNPLPLILTAVVGGPDVVERERDKPAALACSRAEMGRVSKARQMRKRESTGKIFARE